MGGKMLFSSLLFAIGCAPKGQHLDSVALEVGGYTVDAEIADSPEEREQGLMYRDPLPMDHGMIFVYPEASERHFWMKNTPIPLSIAFLNSEGRVVSTAELEPYDTTPVPSQYPAMYALEMSRGWFVAHNIVAGAKVSGLPGPAAE